MKAPHSPPDPLLQSLVEEAADLPIRAAAEARKAITQRRLNRQQTALVAAAFLIGIFTWNALPSVRKLRPGLPEAGPVAGNHAVKPEAFQSLPTGLNPEQTAFVKAAGDMPLLFVRNSSGQVTRIHVIER
jgi:hypothetical protein